MRRWAVLIAIVVVAVTVVALPGGGAKAQGADCASLGQAAAYDVFSAGALTMASQTMDGRAAAAGDGSLASMEMGGGTDEGFDLVSGGRITGNGGVTVNGDVRYRDSLTGVVVNGGVASQGPPPDGLDFAKEFTSLATLGDFLGAQRTTPGATYTVQPWALQLQGAAGSAVSVLNLSAQLLRDAPRFQINAPAGSTLVVNVHAQSESLSVNMDAMDLTGITPSRILWNLVGVTAFNLTGSIQWKGTLLAPNTPITKTGNNQDWNGQVLAKSAAISGLHMIHSPFDGCAPAPPLPPEPGPELAVSAKCVDTRTAPESLIVMLRNSETKAVTDIAWKDEDSAEKGTIASVDGSSDYYFGVPGAAGHTITVTKGSTTVSTKPTTSGECEGTIVVTKQTVGNAPAGTWPIGLYAPNNELIRCEDVAAGGSFETTVPGGFTTGVSVPIGASPGGPAYSVRELNAREGTASVSLFPITVTDPPQPIGVTVTNTYGSDPVTPLQATCADPNPTPPEPEPEPEPEPGPPSVLPGPDQPTVPDGAPDPPSGPDLVGVQPGEPGADLVVTHSVTPRRIRIGQTVKSVTRIRNAGTVAAVGVVARELPQYRRLRASRVTRILSLSTSAGTCSTPRPARCELGTIQPGQEVVIRGLGRPLVAGVLTSTIFASGETPETNTTNNQASSSLQVRLPASALRVRVSAPHAGRVGAAFSYRVSVASTSRNGTRAVRLCTRIPATFTAVAAPGTFRYKGSRCRDYGRVTAERSFVVRAVPAARGRIPLPGVAAAADLRAPALAVARVRVTGGACASAVRRPRC
jgi:choice-of-anchor A domain-containing protein